MLSPRSIAVCVSKKLKILLALASLLACSFAYVATFGTFTVSDDESYSIATIRLVSEGTPLYTGQFDFHGPAPFLGMAAIFRGFHVPITHTTIRLWAFGWQAVRFYPSQFST